MDERDDEDTQWTETAKLAYRQRTEDLIETLRSHALQTLARQGREREFELYIPSVTHLRDAARAFADAEFDWCGSSPLLLASKEEDDEEDWDEDDVDEGGTNEAISVVGRWDYNVLDSEALIAAGRMAYLRAYPDSTPEDAEFRVEQTENAVLELLHGDNIAAVNDAPGLELHGFAIEVFTHDGNDDSEPDGR